jgi:2-polyprenyl-6-methoxyphenol hydroxylase-like FAD-dependent oxidoreductase
MEKIESSILQMLVIGAGPSGLAFAIELAQRWKEAKKEKPNMINLHITIRDIRIEKCKEDGMYINVGSRTGQMPGRRRDQVVTIQEDVLAHLSPLLKKYMLKNFDECVWPTSRNIPIREIEDQLLTLAQTVYFRDVITFEAVTKKNWNENANSFQIIVGADGSTSKTRQELFGVKNDDIIQYGEDTALGIAFQVPENESPHGLPFEQSVNCALTIAQRRYLLNASKVSSYTFLLLIEKEG